MSDNRWYFLMLILVIVLLGLKIAAWLLAGAFIYWLLVTGFRDND